MEMKVNYSINGTVDLKVIKDELKPFGGRCAKIVDNVLEYQVKDENQAAAYEHLKEKGFIN
jgi:hypothetical protein